MLLTEQDLLKAFSKVYNIPYADLITAKLELDEFLYMYVEMKVLLPYQTLQEIVKIIGESSTNDPA